MTSERKLAAIMFTDIAGYTRMMETNEVAAIASAKLHEKVIRELVPHHHGQLVQFYGDGSLSHFTSASEAVRCAHAIQNAVHGDNYVPIRIGIHIGEIVVEPDKIYGDGVNVAARIESSGHAGTVLFSQSVYEKIKNDPALQTERLGLFRFKNVAQPMHLFALTGGNLVPVVRGQLRNRFKRPLLRSRFGLGALALVIVAGFIGYLSYGKTAPDALRVKAIAILPFENLSTDAEDAQWFSDGVADDIALHLAQIRELKVISRTSSMSLARNSKPIPVIAKELNVDYILEGSVQKVADQAQISAQLVNAKDEQVWANRYTRQFDMDEVFTTQAEVAQKIIGALKVAVTDREASNINRIPTTNVEAYQLLLKGRKAADVRTTEGLRKSLDFYRQAIAIDSNYAEAYAEMANSMYMLGTYNMHIIDSILPEARRYVEKAMSIRPDIARCYTVLGNIYRTESLTGVSKSMAGSLASYRKGIELNPNDATAYLHFSRYYAMKTPPDFRKQLELVEKAVDLDPLSFVTNRALIEAYLLNGRFDEALQHFNEMKFLMPASSHGLILKQIYIAQKDWARVMDLLKQDVANDANFNTYLELGHGYRNYYRDFKSYADQLESALQLEGSVPFPVYRDYILALSLSGRFTEARNFLVSEGLSSQLSEDNSKELEAIIAYYSGDYEHALGILNTIDPRPLAKIGYCQAMLGRKEQALKTVSLIENRSMGQTMREGRHIPMVMVYAGLGMPDSVQHYIESIEETKWRSLFWTTSHIFDVHYAPELDRFRNEQWYRSFLERHNFPGEQGNRH